MEKKPGAAAMRLPRASALALTTLLLVACSKPGPAPEPVRAVKVVTVSATGLRAGAEFSGEVRARTESRLAFRVAGKILRRQAELGQHVKAGDVLAQLDPQDYRLAADAARAQVAAATTNRDLAAADFKRFQTLREQNFISGAELERRETALKAAQAQLDQAQAQLASQGNQARYTTLVADVSGVITGVDAEPGQVVSAGAPVVRIAQDGPRDVVFAVPEDKLLALKPGVDVSVKLWAAGHASVPGKIRELAASADPVTRTYAVKVALDPQVKPPLGSTVTVVPQLATTASAPVLKLPTSALRQAGKDTAVWIVDRTSMTVKSQPVQVAAADGNEAVITSGLNPGDTVVSAGVHVLSPGQKVAFWQDRGAPVAGAAAASLAK